MFEEHFLGEGGAAVKGSGSHAGKDVRAGPGRDAADEAGEGPLYVLLELWLELALIYNKESVLAIWQY